MTKTEASSLNSIIEASRNRLEFSGHGRALGAAGYKEPSLHPQNCQFLTEPGQSIGINVGTNGFESILIGATWDNTSLQKSSLLGKIFKKMRGKGVDLDLGILYEMQDGSRGALQAFGEKFGSLREPPYMQLSGDERTGDKKGMDEFVLVNGFRWPDIKRVLVYIYIYEGAPRWSVLKPQLVVDIPGENDLYVTLRAHNDALSLCAVGGLENVRGGIKLTNYTEYFPGHLEMDRAFGFGLEWKDGRK